MPPTKKKYSQGLTNDNFLKYLVITQAQLAILAMTFLFLFHLQDSLLGSGTDFTVLSSFLSLVFDTLEIFHISIVLTEKQLNEQLSPPNSHIHSSVKT